MDTLTVAAINWSAAAGPDPEDPLAGLLDAVRRANAELVLLPECAVLELLATRPEIAEEDSAEFLASRFDDWCSVFSALSRETGKIILAGTAFERRSQGRENVCPICLPDGRVLRSAKNRLTAYERDVWRLVPGDSLTVLNEPPIGVAICYDSEFPEAVRALANAGAKVLCVPAFTEGRRGFQRVRWCAHARAVENQIFVLHSSLVGGLGREPLPSAFGSSAVLCPSHDPFPESAVLAETPLNEFGVATATLDFAVLEACRSGGDVRNWHDREPHEWRVDS